MVELCTAYFFIGHRGSLTKEDVRSAYDVSKFSMGKIIQNKNNHIKQYLPTRFTCRALYFIVSKTIIN